MRSHWCCRDGSIALDEVDGMQTCEQCLVISVIDLLMRKSFCSCVCALTYDHGLSSLHRL